MDNLIEPKNSDQKIVFYRNDSLRYFKVRRILVTRLRFMGDLILTTPLLTALKNRFPLSEIDYLAEPPYIDLLKNHPAVIRLFSFQKDLFASVSAGESVRMQWNLLKQLKERRYDLAIDLFGIPRSAWITKMTGAPVRVGGCFRYRSHLFTHCFETRSGWKTAIDFHNLALKRLGIHENLGSPKIYISGEELIQAKLYLQNKGLDLTKPVIGIQAGATWPAKIWPVDRFIQLAGRIMQELHCSVFFTFGPKEAALSERIKAEIGPKNFVGDSLPLRQLAAVLACLTVYISNDCGPMHLAPAVGTPVIGLFGPSQPEIWFPYRPEDGHRIVFKKIDCRPCHQDNCPIQHQCMDWISVEDVFDTLQGVLEQHG